MRPQGVGQEVAGPPLAPPGPTLSLAGLTLLDNPGLGGNAALAHLALRHFGDLYRPDGLPWSGWCEMFVGDLLAALGIDHPRFPTALADAASAPLYRGRAPAGSLVFFDARISQYGHVGIALGDGTMVSALGGGIVRTEYEEWPSYVGWRPGGSDATTASVRAPVPTVVTGSGASPVVPPRAAPTATARAIGPRPASMAIGSAGVAAGIVGLPSSGDRRPAVPIGGWLAAATDVGARLAREGADAVAAPTTSSVTSATTGAGPIGGTGPTGAAVGRGDAGAGASGGRGIARWQHDRSLQIVGVGGGAVLLLVIGLGMQRRQAILTAFGRRL